jgi:formylglycine-generating enzyme required for sulfatase activity
VTAVAPLGFTARAVAALRLAISAGFRVTGLAVPIDTEADPILATAAAASCFWLAFVLLPAKAASETPRERTMALARRAAVRVSALAAVASIGWALTGRYLASDVTASPVTAPPPSFHGANRVFLAADPMFGFVQMLSGPVTMGARPSSTTQTSPDTQVQVVTVPWYSIGKYEVTVAQYRQCVLEAGCSASDQRAILGPDTAPVRYVTWFEALRYCRWLRGKLQQIAPDVLGSNDVSLPSEPELQRAAGDGTSPYPWNGPLTPLRANYAGSGLLGPAPVGEHASGASAYGVQDLAGNVAEWTRSEYRRYPYDPNDGRENIDAPASSKVIRGGSFYDSGSLLRVDSRQAADPNRAYDFVGFRVVLVSSAASNRGPTSSTTSPTAAPTGK